MNKQVYRILITICSLVLFTFFLILGWNYLDLQVLLSQTKQFFLHGKWVIFATICYFLAFILRAIAWRMYGKSRKRSALKIYLFALFYSLFFNHIFPFKIGEIVRIGVIASEKEEDLDQIAHSVIVLRILDLLCLGLFSLIGALLLSITLSYSIFICMTFALIIGSCVFLVLMKKILPHFFIKHVMLLKELFIPQSLLLLFFVFTSWVLEAVVLYGVVQAINVDLSFITAIWVNSMTVASQVFQFAPGGIGTYESTMSFALSQNNISWQDAYHVALITHGYKFIFSYIVGGIVFILHPISFKKIILWKRKKG